MDIKLISILKKQGGAELIRRYIQGGAFWTAVGEFLLLGKSRIALEILRLSAQLKIRQKLERRYISELEKFDNQYDVTLSHEKSNKVWVCWFQGIKEAPDLVKVCYESLKSNLPHREIVLITLENLQEYVTFPQFILDKWEKGIITNTHMTDLLRLELLIKYGGMWVDATVLCTQREEKIPLYYFESDLFCYQLLKPGRDGHSIDMSSWLMSAKTNNKILYATRYLCYKYWERNDKMVDYFLVHHFLSIVLEYYPEERNAIVPVDNAAPHILLLRIFEQYDEKMWEFIKVQTPFHKLSYKFEKELVEKSGTFYDKIVNIGK